MKLLLFLEHKFFIEDGKIISEKVISYDYLKRYLNVFEEVCLCARVLDRKPITSICPIVDSRISILPLPNYSSMDIIKHFNECKRIVTGNLSDIDCVIIRGPSSIALLAGSITFKKPMGLELVINPETFFYTPQSNFFLKVINAIKKQLFVISTKSLCKKVNGVSYVTAEYLQKKYPSRAALKGESEHYFETHYSSIDLKDSAYSSEINVHNPDDTFVIAHTGWMVGDNKGHKDVIQVLRRLTEDGKDCKVVFIGDGPKLNEFKEYANKLGVLERVEFAGKKDSFEQIQELLSEAHLFLFPSINEGLPRAIIEALANSVPCVAYNSDGIPELLDEFNLVKPNDIEGLIEKVEYYIDHEEERVCTAKKGYGLSKQYNYEVLTKRRNDFYTKIRLMAE